MLRWILPLVVIQMTIALWTALAHAEGYFGRLETWGCIGRVLGIVSILIFYREYGVWALILGLWVNIIVNFAGCYLVLLRSGFEHRIAFRARGDKSQQPIRKLLTTSPYVFCTQFYQFVLDAALSTLQPGYFALFKYASQVISKAGSLVVRPVSTVFFSHYSLGRTQKEPRLDRLVQDSISRTLAFTSVMLVLMINCLAAAVDLFSASIASGFNLGKEFTLLVCALFLSVYINGLSIIARKMAASVGAVSKTYYLMAVGQLLNAGIAVILIERWGLIGAAATFFCNSLLMLSAAYVALWTTKTARLPAYSSIQLVKWIFLITASYYFVESLVTIWSLFGAPGGLFSILLLRGFASIFVVVMLGYLLGLDNLRDLIQKIRLRRYDRGSR